MRKSVISVGSSIISLIIFGVCLFPQTVFPQTADRDFKRLISAKSLKCTVGPGYSSNWKTGSPVMEKSNWKKENVFHYDSIDSKKGKARLIGNVGAANVMTMATARGIHFIEQTSSGNMVFSTVFFHRTAKGYAFVFSRHLDFGKELGGPFPSQYHGTCKIFD